MRAPPVGRRSPRAVSSSRDDGASGAEERRGLQPRYRRAFGCVTWLYMAILTFLAAAFLLLLPFRYVGSGEVYKLLGGLSFFGLVLIVPGTALAAALGARTYRSQRRRGHPSWFEHRRHRRLVELLRPRLANRTRGPFRSLCGSDLLRFPTTRARSGGPRAVRAVLHTRTSTAAATWSSPARRSRWSRAWSCSSRTSSRSPWSGR